MKASKPFNLLILILVLSNGIVFAQPGNYYPPPSSISYQTDTLIINPPDSLPGDPVILLGYNIYVDDDYNDNVMVTNPLEPVYFYLDDESLVPGERIFCVDAVYNEWISESTCDTDTILYGYELPFFEDWSSASFESLQWTTNSDHWVINSGEGNPAPSATFQGEPGLTDYEAVLESYPCNSVGMTEGRIWLDFHLKLDANQSTGKEMLQVQVWNWQTQVWYTVADYNNYEGSFSWESEHINIKALAMNKVFKIRFVALGENSANISYWSIDNIHVYRSCASPTDFDLEEKLEYNELNWTGESGCWDYSIHWDDGVNSGNSIGTGGPVEFDVAARWTPEMLYNYNGEKINKIAFFPAENAATYWVRVWTGSGPDTLVVNQLVNSPVIGAWNYIQLDHPMVLDTSKELWIGYHVLTTGGYPAGVDDGPAIDGFGNMMYFEGEWQTLLEINNELDYNWNIAGIFYYEPYYEDILYNIYRQTNQNEFEFYDVAYESHYSDSSIILSDYYCYKITQVFIKDGDTCESSPSNIDCEHLNLGTDESNSKGNIRVYPNPAHDFLKIESPEKINEVRLYNMLGECEMKLEIGNWEGRVDVSCLRSGIYFVEVVTAGGTYKSKVLILR